MKQPRRGKPGQTRKTRTPLRVIRVLTEGAVTEPDYLSRWNNPDVRNPDVRIDIVDSGMAPLKLVERARNYQRANRRSRSGNPDADFDEIWCVFDVDEHANLAQALNEARQSDINVALSNPCFELWIVLHFEDQTAHIEAQGAQERAKQLGILDGKHLRESSVDALLNSYDAARQRATQLHERHKGDGSRCWKNPSTSVWRLIDQLR